MSEWLSLVHTMMEDIGVGLQHMVHGGRNGFGLSGAELDDFLRRGIMNVLENGGLPLRGVGRGWVVEDRYGTDPGAITEGVIADWHAAGRPMPEWGEWWFGPRELVAGTAPDRGST